MYSNFTAFGRTLWAKARAQRFLGGFLTIELLISVLIMSTMSSIVLSANSNMSARLQTDNLAHLIALSIREAQTRALSATAPVNASGANAVPGYGVYVSSLADAPVTLFTETDDDRFNPSEANLFGVPRALGQGYTISGLQAEGAGGLQTAGSLSIYFHRPRPDAVIYYGYASPSAPPPSIPATRAIITVRSPKAGVTKTITVTSTGQISVQ